MDVTWQNALTLAFVIAAAWYVVRRLYRVAKGKRRAGCPACSECPGNSAQKPLISIDRPTAPK